MRRAVAATTRASSGCAEPGRSREGFWSAVACHRFGREESGGKPPHSEMIWSLRIFLAKLRPVNAAAIIRVAVVAAIFAVFLWGDFVLFRRLFGAIAQIEAATPFFALGILRNLLALVFLVATVVLFSSALTTAIGSFFTDLDLDVYHSAPRSKFALLIARYCKTLLQSAAVVFAFLAPVVVAFAEQYPRPWTFPWMVLANIALLLTIPVSLACTVIILLVRWFPVRRVHQIVATLAILVLTLAVLAFRVSRPERLFTDVRTDDVVAVLKAIQLPAIDLYPGTAVAELMAGQQRGPVPWRVGVVAAVSMGLFFGIAVPMYFPAFVRARESMAPVAFGSQPVTRWIDRLLSRGALPTRALAAKEIRVLTRDVAQWSQLLLMFALMFIYLYNIRMLPLGGDGRASIIAYANLGMAGFVVAAIALRFAYPSISAEGKAFWLVQVAPVSYRSLLRVKVLTYGLPLVALALILTAFANVLLRANLTVWLFTTIGAAVIAATLVCLGVGMGALDPDFNAENPIQVGLSLGGFAYMAIALLYVGIMMVIMARPVMRYFFWYFLKLGSERPWISVAAPIALALALSATLALAPLFVAERRLSRLRRGE
jgi:ABC-2 type transport system permease protein